MWKLKFQVGDLIYWTNLISQKRGLKRQEDVGLVVKRGPDEIEVFWLASDEGFCNDVDLGDLAVQRELFTQQAWDKHIQSLDIPLTT